MDIIISQAVEEDAEQICAVHLITWLDTYPNDEYGITVEAILAIGLDRKEKIEQRRKYLSEQNDINRTYVARMNDKIVGMCVGTKYSNENKIQSLYILPEFQGRGIGKKLMSAIIDWFGPGKNIFLGVANYNLRAQEFYEHMGFKKTGIISEFKIKPGGKEITEIIMIKVLG